MKTILSGTAVALALFIGIACQAQTNGLTLVDQVPPFGTFWLLSSVTGPLRDQSAPLPCDPGVPGERVYSLGGDGQNFLIDDSGDENGVVANAMTSAMRFAPIGGSGGGGGPLCQFSTNDFYVEILGGSVTNNSASFTVHAPQPGVFDLFFTTNFEPAAWFWIARGLPDQTNFTELGFLPPTNGFFVAGTTNGLDSYGLTTAYYDLVGGTNTLTNDLNNNTIPDYWEIEFFGDLSQSATNSYDGTEGSNLEKYQNGIDPNQITCSLWFSQPLVNVNSATGSVAVLNGVPSYMAVLVNNTNFAAAVWQPFSSNFVAALGTNDGDYDVWLGLRGRAPVSEVTWLDATVTRDTVPPILVISNPAPGSTIARPIVQLQGSGSKPLQSLSFDLTNAAGSVFNQPGFIVHQQVDTNAARLSTNWFQCYDMVLTNGLNAFTLRATDLAGNTTTTNFAVTFDPTTGTNPPVITVLWPPDQSQIAGTNFSLRGILDDDTATISVSGLGTNAIAGTVERGGTFRVANLPLPGPTNVLTLTASNAAGFASTVQLTVFQSSVSVTVDPIDPASLSQSFITVTGEISDTNEILTVNGIQAAINDDGTWQADNVPVIANQGTADFDLDLTPTQNQPDPVATVAVVMPSVVRVAAYTEVYESRQNVTGGGNDTWTRTRAWEPGVGGSSRQQYADSYQYPGGCDSQVAWPAFWPDGQALTGNYCHGTYAGQPSLPWMNYGLQSCGSFTIRDFGAGFDLVQASSSRRVQTMLELAAGGPAQSGGMRLILLTVSAAGYSQPLPLGAVLGGPPSNENDYDSPGNLPVALADLAVNGQPVTPSATNPAVGQVLVTAPAGSVQSLPITVSGANSRAYSVNPPQVEDVTLQSLTVVSNSATQIDATNWAAVKSASTNDVVIVQAVLSLPVTNVALLAQAGAAIQWTGGQPVPGNPLQREVSKTNSVETVVTATLGTTNLSLNVWIIWADLTIKVSGTLDPDDQAAVLLNGNFPTVSSTNFPYGLGGGNNLGPLDRFSNTNMTDGYSIGKMEAKAILQPSGIGSLLTTNWNMKRIADAIGWDDGGAPSYTTGNSIPPSWQADNGSRLVQDLNPINGDIFDLDWPVCPIRFGQPPDHTSEVYDNFYEYVTVNIGNGDQICSISNTYSYTAQIDFDATNVQLNALSTSINTLPSSPHYSQR